MRIQVLGPGCANCERLYENVLEAVNQSGMLGEIVIEKVRDIDTFIRMGVFTTPGLVVDGETVSVGRVLDPGEILEIIQKKGRLTR